MKRGAVIPYHCLAMSTTNMTKMVLPLLASLLLLLMPADALAVSEKIPSLTFYNNAQRS